MQNSLPEKEMLPATAKRRLLSMVYDSLLLAAVLFIGFAIFIMFMQIIGVEPGHSVKSVYLLSLIFLFYAGFWTHGGQTLGMKTWRIKLVNEEGHGISWSQALLRYMTALPCWFVILIGISGLIIKPLPFPEVFSWINKIPMEIILLVGLVWLYLEQRPNNWRDRFSHTKIIRISYSTNAS
jgi:uncharacterized RDD family membrane protein YckC